MEKGYYYIVKCVLIPISSYVEKGQEKLNQTELWQIVGHPHVTRKEARDELRRFREYNASLNPLPIYRVVKVVEVSES